MTNFWEKTVGASSLVLRISSFVFLRWIPGHHFPPLIISALLVYLSIVLLKGDAFGFSRPSLREAFPAIFKSNRIAIVHKDHTDVVQAVEVEHDDPVLYDDEYPFFKTMLMGIPDWREWELSWSTIGLNILVTLLTIDFVFRGPVFHPSTDLRFSRLGFVDDTSAKILFREPDSANLPIIAYIKEYDAADWTEATHVYYVGPETDYTHPLSFEGLKPATSYVYTLSNDLTGTFQTAPAAQTAAAKSLTFLTSSCIKANFPYRPSSHSLAIHGFEYLSKVIRSLASPPAFMMFLGDFIYVDVPQRLSSSFSHYRSEYRRVYASPSWKLSGISTIPWIHTLDDHEIANDWSGGNQTSPFPAASDPFIHYHVSVNPPIPPSSPPKSQTNTTYFQFIRGPASFFMLDTRRYRTDPETASAKIYSSNITKPFYGGSRSTSDPPSQAERPATMLGKAQLNALLVFLRKPEPRGVHWKFIASSVPFTKNWRFGTPDTWGGFPTERSEILAAMHEAEANLGVRIIILSGDRHEFAAIRFPPVTQPKNDYKQDVTPTLTNKQEDFRYQHDQTPQAGPHEFSVGPLSMFYLPIRTFKQVDDEDVAIKYLPDGNSKVGVVDIQSLTSAGGGITGERSSGWFGGSSNSKRSSIDQQSLLKYSLWIDGKIAWEYTLTSPGPTYK